MQLIAMMSSLLKKYLLAGDEAYVKIPAISPNIPIPTAIVPMIWILNVIPINTTIKAIEQVVHLIFCSLVIITHLNLIDINIRKKNDFFNVKTVKYAG